jgi:hypothetical protein
MISENPELTTRASAQTKAYRDLQKKILGVAKIRERIKYGTFRDTELLEWNGNFDAILYTAFVYPEGRKQGQEFLRLAALLRKSDCVNLGANWEFRGDATLGAPSNFVSGGVTLDKAAARQFERQNSYRFDTSFVGSFGYRGTVVMDLISSERFAAGGKPVVSSLGRGFCDAETPSIKREVVSGYPARAHRVVLFRLSQQKAKGRQLWPSATGTVVLSSGTFGERKMDLWSEAKPVPFDPDGIVGKIYGLLDPLTHRLNEQVFRILKRQGRWVYLDRGRAYGLEIGTHLVGRGASLHVIQYAPWEKDLDVAIALVRTEDPDSPLKEGESITFDPKIYGSQSSGDASGSGGGNPAAQGPVSIPLAPPPPQK